LFSSFNFLGEAYYFALTLLFVFDLGMPPTV